MNQNLDHIILSIFMSTINISIQHMYIIHIICIKIIFIWKNSSMIINIVAALWVL